MDCAVPRAGDEPLDVLYGSGGRQVLHAPMAPRGFSRNLIDNRIVVTRGAARQHGDMYMAQTWPRVEPGDERREQCEHDEEDGSLHAGRQEPAATLGLPEHALQAINRHSTHSHGLLRTLSAQFRRRRITMRGAATRL